jgi:hypothetical protein
MHYDQLKVLLQGRRVKCGGTLLERSERWALVEHMADDNIPKKLRAKKKSVCWCWMLVLVKWVDRLIHVSCKRCGRECLAPLDLLMKL